MFFVKEQKNAFTINLRLLSNIGQYYILILVQGPSINDSTHFLRFFTPSSPLLPNLLSKQAYGLTSPFGRSPLPQVIDIIYELNSPLASSKLSLDESRNISARFFFRRTIHSTLCFFILYGKSNECHPPICFSELSMCLGNCAHSSYCATILRKISPNKNRQIAQNVILNDSGILVLKIHQILILFYPYNNFRLIFTFVEPQRKSLLN